MRKHAKKLCKMNGITLREQLANRWIETKHCNRKWQYIHDIMTNQLYDTYKMQQYRLRLSTRRKWYFHWPRNIEHIPTQATPVTPISTGQNVKELIPSQFGKTILEKQQPTTQRQTTIRYAVSNGSVEHGKLTFVWVKGTFTQTLESNYAQVEGSPGLTRHIEQKHKV